MPLRNLFLLGIKDICLIHITAVLHAVKIRAGMRDQDNGFFCFVFIFHTFIGV